MAPADPVTMSSPRTPSLEMKISRRFLKSLVIIRTSRKPATEGNIQKRAQRIKIAAYSSMARAAGSRRAWSRALLAKLRSRALLAKLRSRSKHHCRLQNRKCLGLKKKRGGSRNMVPNEVSRADELRQLVPGGKAMDLCNLLEETGHFIQCLVTQVKVMQSIADRYSV